MNHLRKVLDSDSISAHEDILSCRAYGSEKLCDGFVCQDGSGCQSGCCASLSPLKNDYCQPLVEGVCPAVGFTYGPRGDIYRLKEEEAKAKQKKDKDDDTTEKAATPKASTDEKEELDPLEPHQYKFGKTEDEDAEPLKENFKENKFWYGVLAGCLVLVIALGAFFMVYYCCCKRSTSSVNNESAQYQDLPDSKQNP